MAKKTTYLIGKGGVLTVKDFEPRTFGEALEADLKKGWKKDPAKLVKAVETNPDILTAAIGLMSAAQDVIGGELDKLSSAIDAVYEKATVTVTSRTMKQRFWTNSNPTPKPWTMILKICSL